MKNLEIVNLEFTETQTVINFNSYDDLSDQGQPSIGAWTVSGVITNDQALEYAKTMVDSDTSVSLKLN